MTVSEAVLDKTASAPVQGLVPTPNDDGRPRRYSDFETFCDALDYAAEGEKGMNFHDPRGTLVRVYPFRELRADALVAAQRLIAMGIEPGDRVALIAETGTDFAALFCGAIYAGAWPVPLPLPTSFGGKENYIDQIAVQLASSDPKVLFFPGEIAEMCGAAAERQGCKGMSWAEFDAIVPGDTTLPTPDPDAICYLQYSSGSTRFPHGVAVTHRALLANLAGQGHGIDIREGDRCISWLPWYHDMGLVGCFLSTIGNQLSVDYLRTEDFARRPLAWLDVISRNPGTTISYSPTFGFDICSRRISSQTNLAERFDLSRWRVAGNGADMIRPDVMQAFVDVFSAAGFKANAFLPSYGLAEATLAVTLMPPAEGIRVELVEEERLSGAPRDLSRPARYRAIVNCGVPVRGMEIEIRGENGSVLAHHHIGKVWCRGSSVMHSYFRDPESTDAALVDGWLDTGDMGYLNAEGYLFIVGRAKDMIIINGKNHWPQDIEWAVEQLPGFHQGDIAAFSIETENGEEAPAVLVHCRVSDPEERVRLHEQIREKVRSITGMNCVVELVPPRTLPRTSSGKLSRAKAKKLYLAGEIEPYRLAA
ncbi:acyl-CoA synthetase [Novosphingobium nitrogenifigens DSM 19370]|uniref:Acyl-CoA synthetase n=1 Tax=Novosphingobium nitrogenifigens DSM 19370 TaxID=983920 RepID=F1Z6G5_9SPHN|nr:fatty acyl-AMP ligase [Novosphingobium nitrogenifigens]EGD59947.1 acyl-CoA synthetase [Novosphingobium nitrogenifigens DSM 19370]